MLSAEESGKRWQWHTDIRSTTAVKDDASADSGMARLSDSEDLVSDEHVVLTAADVLQSWQFDLRDVQGAPVFLLLVMVSFLYIYM